MNFWVPESFVGQIHLETSHFFHYRLPKHFHSKVSPLRSLFRTWSTLKWITVSSARFAAISLNVVSTEWLWLWVALNRCSADEICIYEKWTLRLPVSFYQRTTIILAASTFYIETLEPVLARHPYFIAQCYIYRDTRNSLIIYMQQMLNHWKDMIRTYGFEFLILFTVIISLPPSLTIYLPLLMNIQRILRLCTIGKGGGGCGVLCKSIVYHINIRSLLEISISTYIFSATTYNVW